MIGESKLLKSNYVNLAIFDKPLVGSIKSNFFEKTPKKHNNNCVDNKGVFGKINTQNNNKSKLKVKFTQCDRSKQWENDKCIFLPIITCRSEYSKLVNSEKNIKFLDKTNCHQLTIPTLPQDDYQDGIL